MDIEGAEPAALSGMRRTVERNNSLKLIVEFAPDNLRAAGVSPHQFLEMIETLSFKTWLVDEKGGLKPLNLPQLLTELPEGSAVNLLAEK